MLTKDKISEYSDQIITLTNKEPIEDVYFILRILTQALRDAIDDSAFGNEPITCQNGHQLSIEFWGDTCPVCDNILSSKAHPVTPA